MTGGGAYLAAAYLVLLVALLTYLAIMAAKVGRLEREVDELAATARQPRERAGD